MKRREFLAGMGGAAAWPLMARGQQRPAMPMIGALHAASREGTVHFMGAYRDGLKSEGYIEGQNVVIEYRWADGALDRMPSLMAELVSMRPGAITAFGSAAATALAARDTGAARTIPIVFSVGVDPVVAGYVSNLNRPNGNVTGVTSLASKLAPKRVEFLRELIPTATKVALLVNPTASNSVTGAERKDVEEAAHTFGWQFMVIQASTVDEFDLAFVAMARERIGALIIGADTFFYSQSKRLAALAAQHAIPAAGPIRDFPLAGGLMSYSTNIPEVYRQAGVYTAKVLKGVKPADLPVLLPTKYELVINLKTAKALGIEIPSKLLFTADEVIE